MSLGNIIFKTTGIMTKRMRLKTCEKLGEVLTDKAIKTGEKINTEDVSLFLKDVLPAKKYNNITVTGDLNKVKQFYVNEGIMSENASAEFLEGALSSVGAVPSGKIMMDLRISEMNPAEAINTSVHETQHLLYRNTSLKAMIEKIYIKIRGPKWAEKYKEKYAEELNMRQGFYQQSLIGSLGFKSATGGHITQDATKEILDKFVITSLSELRKKLKSFSRKVLVLPNGDKRSAEIIKGVRFALKDEMNSYKAGSAAQKYYEAAANMSETGATRSDVAYKLYSEARKVLKGEVRRETLNNIKRFFGLKPKEDMVMYKKALSKCQNNVLQTAKKVDSSELERLMLNGEITRDEYLGLLSVGEIERAFKNGKMSKDEYKMAMELVL